MVRVESQVTRQALLVVGDEMETDPPPEKLELYTEDGLAVDVGKDRTRARWRGEWVTTPTAPYEQNDFVMHDEKLYILSDFDAYNGVDAPPAAGWAIMTISAGMQFFGEWAPGAFKKQSVVTHDNKLWVANEDIDVLAFEHVGSTGVARDSSSGTTISVDVPAGTEVGDLLVWGSVISSFGPWAKPAEGTWTTLLEIPTQSGSFPVGHFGLYAKIADEDDLGTTFTYTMPDSTTTVAHLRTFRGATLPDPDEVDSGYLENTSFGGTLTTPAGTDPAETNPDDKVYRIFSAQAQNFAYDSGLVPTWESSSDDQDALITDSHNLIDLGSYWSEPGAANPPDFIANSGEHKYNAYARVRLPNPSGWDESKWTLIGFTELPEGSMIWSGEWDDTLEYIKGSVVSHVGSLWIALSDLEADAEPAPPSAVLETARIYVFGNYTFADVPVIYKDTPFTDMASAISSAGNLWMSGSKIVRFHANPGSSVTITTVGGQFVPYKDTGSSGSGNSELIGSAHGYSSPQTFSMPSEGVVNVEIASTVTSITISGTGVDELPALEWEEIEVAGGGGGSAESWHVVSAGGEPAFQNSWGAGSPAVTKFRKNGNVVEIRGFAVKGSPSGRSVIFTLPVGYRIESAEDVMRFPVSGSSTGYVEVFSNGEVKCDEMAYVSLDPVQFSVD
jgi:hypothetical protein